jgi:hypothetical protein
MADKEYESPPVSAAEASANRKARIREVQEEVATHSRSIGQQITDMGEDQGMKLSSRIQILQIFTNSFQTIV